MRIVYYQDEYCYYIRKPAGIPSSFWKEISFLDLLLQQKEKCWIIDSLYAFFWREEELGLLNRLDNDTSGLLYFAKSPRIKREFKVLQSEKFVHKYYLVEVYGNIQEYLDKNGSTISYPIMHHKYNDDRMVVIQQNTDRKKAKGREHHLETKIVEYQFLKQSRTSILLVEIQKGIRHQIRAHLSAIMFPICGDKIYSKSNHKDYTKLQLFSVGIKI